MKDASIRNSLQRLADQFDGELHFDSLTRAIYSTDASVYQETPLAVAIPKTESDIQKLILLANEIGIGIIPRAAGTSLAGQVVGAGIVVDISRYHTSILEINVAEKWVRVQPGVIRDELNLALREHGLMFGPETSTSNRAMIGGMLGNNSCGSNSVVYGSTREHVLEIHGFLADGSRASFSAVATRQFEQKCDPANQSLESSIYREIRDLLGQQGIRDRIRNEFPKPEITRRNTGYAVDLLMDAEVFDDGSDRPFDFCKLLAGSEGTLFLATEIKLNCIELPPPVSALQCAHFENVDEALRATLLALKYSPYAVELMDHFILEGAARNVEQNENTSFVIGQPGAILVTEIRGQTEKDVLASTAKLENEMRQSDLGYAYPVVTGADTQAVWDLRKSGLGVIANVPGDEKPVAVVEDTAVAVDDLPEFIREFNKLLDEKFGLHCVHYAHAGSGEIHLRPILNLKTKSGIQTFRNLASAVANLVKKYQGSLSGEHGDGRLRGEFIARMIGEENYEVIRQIKRIWDPNNVFNPNKIVDTPPMNRHLRYQPGQLTRKIDTVFDFSEQQGVVRAAELCSGSGDCRKTHLAGGTMCPSYMATRDESDSTRARANLLRQVLTNPTNERHPFDSEDLKQVMDLCLSCKGCKRECPSNVDVGKLKAEFLQGYHDVHGVPRKTQQIANYSQHMKLASKVPWLFNSLVQFPVTASLIKRISGIAAQRRLPRLHPTTLEHWFHSHTPHANAGNLGQVYLFCDEFTNFNDTPIGTAAVELLERLGFSVKIPRHVESGRAAMSRGLLRQARALAEENVRELSSIVNPECPLIGIEPSAILSFRDEYPVLVKPALRDQARSLAKNTWLIDEFIEQQIDSGVLDSSRFKAKDQIIRLHGHCHQKALASLKPTIRSLQLPRGHRVRLIPSGCCGMAGSFGYESEHYDLSMRIGELVLFPTIREEANDVLIAASGISCRHQIADGTGRVALHPVEILRRALIEP